MKQKILFITKGFILIVVAVILQGFLKKPGGDYYQIFLNEKLAIERFLTQPETAASLSLTAANVNDQLTIRFSHCGVAGKGRTIALKDEKGRLVKEWKFADSKSTGMQLSVKEVFHTSGKMTNASIYYASKEKPSGQLLTTLHLKKPVVAIL